MATIDKRRGADGGDRFRVRWQDAVGRRHSLTVRSLADARKIKSAAERVALWKPPTEDPVR